VLWHSSAELNNIALLPKFALQDTNKLYYLHLGVPPLDPHVTPTATWNSSRCAIRDEITWNATKMFTYLVRVQGISQGLVLFFQIYHLNASLDLETNTTHQMVRHNWSQKSAPEKRTRVKKKWAAKVLKLNIKFEWNDETPIAARLEV